MKIAPVLERYILALDPNDAILRMESVCEGLYVKAIYLQPMNYQNT